MHTRHIGKTTNATATLDSIPPIQSRETICRPVNMKRETRGLLERESRSDKRVPYFEHNVGAGRLADCERHLVHEKRGVSLTGVVAASAPSSCDHWLIRLGVSQGVFVFIHRQMNSEGRWMRTMPRNVERRKQ